MGILRSLGAPLRNYFNNHFEMVKDEFRRASSTSNQDLGAAQHLRDDVARLAGDVTAGMHTIAAASLEVQQFNARQLSEIRQRSQVSTEAAERMLAELEQFRSGGAADRFTAALGRVADFESGEFERRLATLVRPPVPFTVRDVDDRDKAMLNRMNAHDGYLSQAGLWINEPLSSGFEDGVLALHDVNERVAEIPYVFGKLGHLAPGSRVLDVGCCESVVSISLASLGHHVTALDPRPYPFAHPRLTVVTSPVEKFVDPDGFDAIVLLSTIEHLGVGSYGLDQGERADLAAMAHLRTLLRPDGHVVLTTPFGVRGTNELERTYDVAGVHELLDGYELISEPLVLVRRTRTEWLADRGGFSDVDDDRQRVVMLEARLPHA